MEIVFETNDDYLRETQYPCSCGHCTECGSNFVATPEELLRWAREDEEWEPPYQEEFLK